MPLPCPLIHVWQHDFGEVVLDPAFVEQAQAKWPGDLVHRTSWLDRFCGIEPISEPRWHSQVTAPLKALTERAFVSGHPIKRIKSIAALENF